ncbi:hypothetical protein BJY01DRAFT_233142 [Aspergillus pseudoustus]|uniref:F-box domain-containing protein n=1 Tax=Aspergillus pseudoustus TaxID=1810923 RepID=A0ABR4KG42_9EURO
MASPAPSLQSLPNELLDEVILLLSTPPPSLYRLHQPPSINITKSGNRDLKSLSLASSCLRDLVRPRLFSHGCFELRDLDRYLAFVSSDLCRYVVSVVVKGEAASDDFEGFGRLWWQHLLQSVRPLRLTIIAPPSFIKGTLGLQIPEEHGWAFEIPLQLLQLGFGPPGPRPAPALQVDEQSSLLDCLPWSCMFFNESSSIKAYNHYEYFLYQVPSLFHRWGSLPDRPSLSFSLENLTSFTYVAVFPFYNHVQLVLDAVELMTNLRSLSIQLGPSRNDRVTELEQRGSMDPSDPWMELATGYSLIAHAVRSLGRTSCLSEFTACDYQIEAVRAEIDVILGDILCDGPWIHNGHGTWSKKTSQNTNMERDRVPALPRSMPFPITHSIEPAGPVLAHSLLLSRPLSESNTRVGLALRITDLDPSPSETWNLTLDIEQGLHSPSNNLLRAGTVIGFSRLRGRSPNDNDDEFVGELPRYLLTNWLRRTISTDSTATPQNKAFIIHPSNLTVFSPEKLLASLLSNKHPALSRAQAIAHLDSVQLFPVFDFAAAIEAISEVSDILQRTWKARHPDEHDHHDQENENGNQHRAGAGANHSITFMIAGLDTLTEAVTRASNAVRGAAVLSSALRTLTQLSRMHRSYLSISLVNTSGVGSILRDDGGSKFHQGQGGYGSHPTRNDAVQSMFSTTDEPLFPSLMMRTLDQGIDTHLLASNTKTVPVIEVIKDRTGSGVGKWCTRGSNR